MRNLLILSAVITLCLPAPSSWARKVRPGFWQPPPTPPPALMVRVNRRSQPLQLSKVRIDAKVVGHFSETTLTMTFYNPNSAVMEGDLYFPLPQGAVVSGYALDVKGAMVDGVVVDKDKGRQVFEAEVRKKVDPGLVEWTRGSNFKTRVFPIPGKGSRTIRVSYVSDVQQTQRGAVYYLPLRFRDRVQNLAIRLEVVKAAAKPVVLRGGPQGLAFAPWRDSFIAETKLNNVKLTKDLYLQLPNLARQPVAVQQAGDGTVYFAIRALPQKPQGTPPRKHPKRIGIYWDASLSRQQADHKRELAVLEAYLARLPQAWRLTAYVVLFRNAAERMRSFELPRQKAALMRYLSEVRYDGGTQMASAAPPRGMPATHFNLLFSDGVSNFGDEDPLGLRSPVYAINSASTAGHALLRYVALRTGGAYLNLRTISPQQAAATIGGASFSFLSATIKGGARLSKRSIYPQLKEPVHGSFDLAGKLKGRKATVTLRFGYVGSAEVITQSFVVSRDAMSKGELLRRYWAQRKINDLMVFPERNASAIGALGREHGVVTPYTSLIVLEQLDQYVKYRIRPPAGLKSMRAQYDKIIKRRGFELRRQQQSKLARVIKLWEKRVKWWNTRFRYPPNYRYGVRKKRKSMAGRAMRRSAPRSAPRRMRASADRASSPSPQMEAKAAKPKPAARAQPSMSIKAWDPKTPYMAALKAAPATKRYAVYFEQRKEHGKAPAFFLDCANYFFRQQQRRLAVRVLSNLAELELENPALLRVLAHRLAQLGEFELAAQIFNEVLRLRKEEPQSYRDLALVLERLADKQARLRGKRRLAKDNYNRAMQLLSKVVMERWDRFDEIEVIALTELNNILPKARRIGLSAMPVDSRLLKHLHMDIRIVMTWDADGTDMDLHVVEPSGERAYYGHNRTRIGGLVSKDFTRGYGPEVYAIRRAMRGKYKVRTKFYGSSAAKLAGAVTLQIDVYTNYGRRNQRRRSMTLRLTERKETFTVGTISF